MRRPLTAEEQIWADLGAWFEANGITVVLPEIIEAMAAARRAGMYLLRLHPPPEDAPPVIPPAGGVFLRARGSQIVPERLSRPG